MAEKSETNAGAGADQGIAGINSKTPVKVGADQGIAGTNFKTPEELAAAYLKEMDQRTNLEKKLGEQGSELGHLRSQTGTLAAVLKETLAQKQGASESGRTVDYATEIATVEKQIQELDTMSDDYQRTLASLVAKSNRLVAAEQHEKTLNAASEMMKKELGERDARATRQKFFDENPTFSTPEMQAKIDEYIAKDRTGMHDPFSAFYQIQRDETALEAKRLMDENAEYKKRLNLAKGTDETGKVIVKGQSPGRQQTKQQKVTGKELDAGMGAALRASRGE